MKNYRPFQKINPELLGAKLKSKDGNNLTSVISIDFNDNQYDLPYYTGADIWYNNDDLFSNFVFLDTGLPVGEEIEGLPLIKDKPYIVKKNNIYIIRYFSHKKDKNNYFFTFGQTSLTSNGEFSIYDVICEYTPELWEQYKNK